MLKESNVEAINGRKDCYGCPLVFPQKTELPPLHFFSRFILNERVSRPSRPFGSGCSPIPHVSAKSSPGSSQSMRDCTKTVKQANGVFSLSTRPSAPFDLAAARSLFSHFLFSSSSCEMHRTHLSQTRKGYLKKELPEIHSDTLEANELDALNKHEKLLQELLNDWMKCGFAVKEEKRDEYFDMDISNKVALYFFCFKVNKNLFCRGKTSGLFLYAYNVGIAVFNPRSTRAKPFFNLRTEKVTSVRHADGFKNLSEQSVTCVSTLSKAYAIGDKGLLATLSVSTEEFGVITSASLSVGPVSNSQANGIRMIVGTSEGKLLLSQNFVLSTEPAQIGVEKTVKEHTVAVTTVASTSDLAASEKSIVCATGDVIGSVLLWNSAYQNAVHIPSTYRDAVTDIAFLNKCLSIAVSYGSGKIRIFSSTGNCEVEVCGHAKWINAMAFSPTLEMLASAGEDGVVNVWRLTGEGQEPISFLSSHTITNGIPTGVAFHSTEKMLGVTYYGNEIIHLIKLD